MATIKVNFPKTKLGATFNVTKVYKTRSVLPGGITYLPLSVFTGAGGIPVGIGSASAQELTPPASSYYVLGSQLSDSKKLAWMNLLCAEDGTLINGQISTSAASGTLTVRILTADGSTPSAGNPVLVVINKNLRAITSALTLNLAGGTNYMNLGSGEHAGKEVDVFCYLAWRTASSAVVVGFARFPMMGSRTYNNFNATSTNEKYAAFSNTPAAGDYCVLVGRFNVSLSGAAAYAWVIPATPLIINQSVFETRFLTYAPYHNRGTTPYSNPPTVPYAIYQVRNGCVYIHESHTQNATPGGSGYQLFTLPFTSAAQQPLAAQNVSDAISVNALARATDILMANYDGAAIATASKVYSVNGEYRI